MHFQSSKKDKSNEKSNLVQRKNLPKINVSNRKYFSVSKLRPQNSIRSSYYSNVKENQNEILSNRKKNLEKLHQKILFLIDSTNGKKEIEISQHKSYQSKSNKHEVSPIMIIEKFKNEVDNKITCISEVLFSNNSQPKSNKYINFQKINFNCPYLQKLELSNILP